MYTDLFSFLIIQNVQIDLKTQIINLQHQINTMLTRHKHNSYLTSFLPDKSQQIRALHMLLYQFF